MTPPQTSEPSEQEKEAANQIIIHQAHRPLHEDWMAPIISKHTRASGLTAEQWKQKAMAPDASGKMLTAEEWKKEADVYKVNMQFETHRLKLAEAALEKAEASLLYADTLAKYIGTNGIPQLAERVKVYLASRTPAAGERGVKE